MAKSFEKINGILPTKYFPDGVGLVLEGGGMRGYYSAGVFEAFMDNNIMFKYIIGVSAGAANALTYVSGQRLRSRQIVEHFAYKPSYVGIRNLIFHGSMFNRKLIFDKIPNKYIPFDWDVFNKCDTRFLTGTMDCKTGKTVWFEKNDIDKKLKATIASCAVPIISPIVEYKNYKLLDGGISCPIPIEKSIEDGNKFHVIVLTQNKGYRKKPFSQEKIARKMYKKYPEMINSMVDRHNLYNRQIELCEKLEAEGKAVIIRPLEPLEVGRTTNDAKALLKLYDEGHKEAADKLKDIFAMVK